LILLNEKWKKAVLYFNCGMLEDSQYLTILDSMAAPDKGWAILVALSIGIFKAWLVKCKKY
jgi:hypothetical protein